MFYQNIDKTALYIFSIYCNFMGQQWGGIDYRVTLIRGSAGFGKTSLASRSGMIIWSVKVRLWLG